MMSNHTSWDGQAEPGDDMGERIPLLLFCLLVLGGACSDTPTSERKATNPWSDQEEVLYQTREVIRYVDEQQRLERERLDSLNIVPAGPGSQPMQSE